MISREVIVHALLSFFIVGGMLIFGSYMWSKVLAIKTSEVSLWIIPAIEEYENVHGVLPAVSKVSPLREVLYPFVDRGVDFRDYKINIPLFRNLNPKINDISTWYYYCPPSQKGQLSTLILIAPILEERDIELTAGMLKKFTGWNYEIRSVRGEKYLYLYSQAMCKKMGDK